MKRTITLVLLLFCLSTLTGCLTCDVAYHKIKGHHFDINRGTWVDSTGHEAK